jgi:DNA-binding CsgD family transcriptional regulator
MERLNHSDYSKLLNYVAGLMECRDMASFGKNVVRLTAELIPGVVVAFDQIDLTTGFYGLDHNAPIDVPEQLRVHARLQEVFQQNPIYQYLKDGGKGPVVDLDDLVSRRDLMRTDFYQDIFRPYGIRHQASVILSRRGWINTLTVNHGAQISPRVKAILELASRHIRLAHETACEFEHRGQEENGAEFSLLTPRECEVMNWMRQGKRNAEIAVILGCSVRTVDKHVENILRKCGAETRTAAVLKWSRLD